MTKVPTWRVYVVATTCGGIAGAFVALAFSPRVDVQMKQQERQTTSPEAVAPTNTTALRSLVPVERPALPLIPPSFLTRRSSAVAALYRKPKGVSFDERLLGPDRSLGHAVALTSDGWFVTSASVFDMARLSDVVVWHNKTSYTPERGFIDRLNHTAFFKTNARDLSVSAFIQPGQVSFGANVWVEVRPDGFVPNLIVDSRARIAPNEYASSEVASRRFLLSGRSASSDRGGAVWNSNGSLVGIIDSREGEEVRVIPATSIASSFAQLLDRNEIRHAQLGVRALDLATARFYGSRGHLPGQGALLRVHADTPAARAMLKSGDVILRVGHDILDGTADLGEILADYRHGSIVTLRVVRRTSDIAVTPPTDVDLQVTLGSVRTSEPLK